MRRSRPSRTSGARVPAALLILALMVAAGRTAHADDDPRQVAAARYAQGIELAKQGLYEAALEQFQNAYAASPHFAVLYNIGQAQIALGRPVDAIEALSRYLRDGADQVPLSRREQVQAQIALLEARLAELSVTSNRAGATIRVDQREVGRTPLPQPLRLAAGVHAVTASVPDGGEVSRTIALGEAERQGLTLDFSTAVVPPIASATVDASAVAPVAAPPPALPLPVLHATPAPAPSAPHGRAIRRAAYVVAAAGVLAGAAALAVYLHDRGRYDDWQRGNAQLVAGSPGTATYRAQASADNQLATSLTRDDRAMMELGIASGALLATGATLFFLDRHAERSPSSGGAGALSLAWAGGATAGIAWSRAW